MVLRTPSERDKKAIGSRFATVRQNRGMSQVALSKKSGAHQSVINRLESGERMPGLPTLLAVASALGGPLAWFIEGKGELPELPPVAAKDRDQRLRDR